MGNSAIGRGTAIEENKVKASSGDGSPDFVVHFKASETGIACGDMEATLTGETSGSGDGPFEGTDAVKTVGCK